MTTDPTGTLSPIHADLAVAFTAEFDDAQPLPEGLRAVTPLPPRVDFEALQAEAARRRILILRGGAVIAVSTLLSIGGALLVHSLIGGAFLAAFLFGSTSTLPPGIGSGGDAPSEGGQGYLIAAETSDLEGAAAAGRPDLLETLSNTDGPPPTAIPPALPPSLPSLPDTQLAAIDPRSLIPEPIDPTPIVPDDFGTIRVKPPVRTPVAPPPEQPLAIPPDALPPPSVPASPPRPALSPDAPPPTNAIASALQQPNPGGLRGNFGEVIDSDEALPSLFKRGAARGAGRGTGGGSGIGSGIDRGPSGADRPEPSILDNPMPQLPAWLASSSHNPVTFVVRVLDTGDIGRIDLIESSGRPEIDAFYLEVLSKWKFSPAVRGGKPITAPFQTSFGDMRR